MGSTFTIFDFFILLAGVFWLVKKVAERSHDEVLRVIILTTILSCIGIYLLHCLSLEAGFQQEYGCYISFASQATKNPRAESLNQQNTV